MRASFTYSYFNFVFEIREEELKVEEVGLAWRLGGERLRDFTDTPHKTTMRVTSY